MTAVHRDRLEVLRASVNSSLAFDIITPRKCIDVYVKVGLADRSGYYAPVKCAYSPAKNAWWCYIPPVYFPIGGKTQYKVVARDADGNRFNIGQQILRVVSDAMRDPNEDENVSAVRDCHIQMDGKWYAVRVVEDGTQLTFDVAQKETEIGTEYVAETGMSPTKLDYRTPYAYDPYKNLYFPVEAYLDSTNTISARVIEEGVEEGERSFCYDSQTGFWYAMDAQEVDGEECLVVGDRK